MKKVLISISILLLSLDSFAARRNNESYVGDVIKLDNIESFNVVLDEWRYPARYSPLNLFDGKPDTCYAEGNTKEIYNNSNIISIRVRFKAPVYIDEIRIMNGYSKSEKTFINNNRLKYIEINIPSNTGRSSKIFLKDEMKYQSYKFNKSYKVITLDLRNSGQDEAIYKGNKYNDSCISEIVFYNKGKRIPIMNLEIMNKKYLKRIEYYLLSAISVKNKYTNMKKYKWKVENYKLYKFKDKKWQLVKYILDGDYGVILIE